MEEWGELSGGELSCEAPLFLYVLLAAMVVGMGAMGGGLRGRSPLITSPKPPERERFASSPPGNWFMALKPEPMEGVTVGAPFWKAANWVRGGKVGGTNVPDLLVKSGALGLRLLCIWGAAEMGARILLVNTGWVLVWGVVNLGPFIMPVS